MISDLIYHGFYSNRHYYSFQMITKRDITEPFYSKGKFDFSSTLQFVLGQISHNLTEDEEKEIKYRIRNVQTSYHNKLKVVAFDKAKLINTVEKRNKWECFLNTEFDVQVLDQNPPKRKNITGRRSLSFKEKGIQSQKLEAKDLANNIECTEKLILAASIKAKDEGLIDVGKVLKKLFQNSQYAKQVLESEPNVQTSKQEQKLSPIDALAICYQLKLSRNQYHELHMIAKSRNSDFFPSKGQLLHAKKLCLPLNINQVLHLTDLDACIELQSLLDHTLLEIMKQIPKDVLDNIIKSTEPHLKFFVNWGMDGAGTQPIYTHTKNAKDTNPNREAEGYIFATNLVPLRIEDLDHNIFWLSPAPQSERFCRPVRLQFQKESKQLVLSEHHRMLQEIEKMQCFTFMHKDTNICIDYELHEAMLDGKCLNYVLGNDCTQRCPICGTMNTQFNDLHKSFPPLSPDTLKHGIAPLHCCIRSMEALLKASYRRTLKMHAVSKHLKPIIEQEKCKIVTELHEKVGIVVDKVKPGFGTTNTGNIAKRFFSQPDIVAEILQLPIQLVNNFSIITRLLNLQIPLNWKNVTPLLQNTKKLWIEHLSWFPMPPSIHKVLEHAPQIGLSTQLTFGELSEDCGEAAHKVIPRTRMDSIRKNSKIKGMEDLMVHLLLRSSPTISTINIDRIIKREAKGLSPDLLHYVYLTCPENNTDSDADEIIEDEDSYIESDMMT